MYEFDPHLSAPSVMKERVVWMLYMGILFFLLYGSANQYASLTGPHPSYCMGWEQNIPFIPSFIVPYMSSDIMFVLAFLMPYTRLELRIFAARVLFIVLVAVAFFILFPLACSFEKPEIGSFSFLFSALEADLPFNQAPSLHIAFAVIIWASMNKYIRSLWLKIFLALWLCLIALSTLFVYQHHMIDLPTGAALGLLAVYLFKEESPSVLLSSFTTPRSLKMALYYLLASALFMALSFGIHGVFLWIFLSLFLVSLTYAFGLNYLIAGKNVKASWLQWLFFAPYFIGNYLSWHYFKRKLTLVDALKENVYLGRYPCEEEYVLLKEKGISFAINLALEQQVQKEGLAQKRFPFLDQTIQSPESLHEVVTCIEIHKEEGVYVHCTLGLSRSVLAVSAWLLYQGYSIDEAKAEVAKVRPKYVKSPYMEITLEIYQAYLKELST